MKRLTRKEIEQGLQAMPVDTLLLGVSTAKEKRLTHKQIEFAKQVALGESKAGAYRKSHNSKGKPSTQSKNGQALAKNKAIQTQIDAFKVALEAQKYQTPAHLRALAIHRITEKALDPECPPAQQLKALELLGKITEVALFTERRTEVIKVSDPSEMREKLMASIRLAIENSQAIDIEARSADDLLAELVGTNNQDDDVAADDKELDDVDNEESSLKEVADPSQNADLADPRGGESQILALPTEANLHSIPHTQSPPKSTEPRENPASP
jgi:hypothetical protein